MNGVEHGLLVYFPTKRLRLRRPRTQTLRLRRPQGFGLEVEVELLTTGVFTEAGDGASS